MDTTNKLAVGGRYNWKGQPERLVYIGRNWSGNGYWHQFELVGRPGVVWCEVVDADLGQFEESPADAAQATQAVSEPVAMQPAEAVAEFKNGSWRLRIGSVYMTAPNPPAGPWMVNEEHQAKMYAARINAEIAGGVAAFGCDVEASGDSARGRNGKRCQSWCGLAKCAMSLRAAIVAHPSPASASEPERQERAEPCPKPGCNAHWGITCSDGHMRLTNCPHWSASASVAGAGEALRAPMPDDILTVANIEHVDGGSVLTLLASDLGDLVDIVGEEDEHYLVHITGMKRADFEALGEFDGF